MAKLRYTKEHLEQIVLTQLDNLEAMGNLLRLIKEQNYLLAQHNDKLKEEIEGTYKKVKSYPKASKKKLKE
jgi:hypothetical protein